MSQIVKEENIDYKEMNKKEKKQKPKVLTLEEEAFILSPILTKLVQQFQDKMLNDYDLVAYFVLLYLSIRKPNGWSNGRLDYPIITASLNLEDSLKLQLSYKERSNEALNIIQDIIQESVQIENDPEGKFSPTYLPKQKFTHTNESTAVSSAGPSLKNKPAIVGNFNSKLLIETDPEWQAHVNLEYIAHKLCLLKNKKLPLKTENNYQESLFNILKDFTLLDVFNNLMLTGIKGNTNHLINKNLVFWGLKERPYKLLSYIPTPNEVLKQQSYGLRVITLFHTPEKLSIKHISKLVYMLHIEEEGETEEKKEEINEEEQSNDIEIKENNEEINTENASDDVNKKKNILLHSRDCFYFLLHDCQHMEHYTQDIVLYYEQSGFFNAFFNVNQRKIKSFFINKLNYNKKLYNEIEYVISDM